MESLNNVCQRSLFLFTIIGLLTISLISVKPSLANQKNLKNWDSTKRTPPLLFENRKGAKFSIKTFRGNVIVINFWASWCAPCVKEIPSLIDLADSFQNKPFKLIMVNFGESLDKVNKFSKKLSSAKDVYLDKKKLSNDVWVTRGLPITYILDKKGNIKHVALGELSWNSPEVKKVIQQLIR